jgi:hypothetical protein
MRSSSSENGLGDAALMAKRLLDGCGVQILQMIIALIVEPSAHSVSEAF